MKKSTNVNKGKQTTITNDNNHKKFNQFDNQILVDDQFNQDLAKKAQDFNQPIRMNFHNNNKYAKEGRENNNSRDTVNSNYNRDHNVPKRNKFIDSSENFIYKDQIEQPISRLDQMYNAKKNMYVRNNSEAYELSVSNSNYNDKLVKDLHNMMNPRYMGQRTDQSLFEGSSQNFRVFRNKQNFRRNKLNRELLENQKNLNNNEFQRAQSNTDANLENTTNLNQDDNSNVFEQTENNLKGNMDNSGQENSGTQPFNHMTGIENYSVHNKFPDWSEGGLGVNKVKGFIDFDLVKDRGVNINLSYDVHGRAFHRNHLPRNCTRIKKPLNFD